MTFSISGAQPTTGVHAFTTPRGGALDVATDAVTAPSNSPTRARDPFAGFDREALAQNAAMRDALRGGTLVQDPRGRMASSGITGPPQLVQVTDAKLGTVPAIRKQGVGTYPLAEEFATDLAERMGIGYLGAPSVEGDGAVITELVTGTQARKAHVLSSRDLEQAIAGELRARVPGATMAEVADRARIDRQLVQVFDHALAIPDRHGRNLMVDPGRRVTMIDHSELLGGTANGVAGEPRMMRRYMSGVTTLGARQQVPIDADVRALIAERMPAGTIDTMLGQLRARPGFGPATAGKLVDDGLARTIGERLDDVVTSGVARYRYDAKLEFVFEHFGNLIDDYPKLASLVTKFHR